MGQGIKIFIVNLHHDAQPMIDNWSERKSTDRESPCSWESWSSGQVFSSFISPQSEPSEGSLEEQLLYFFLLFHLHRWSHRYCSVCVTWPKRHVAFQGWSCLVDKIISWIFWPPQRCLESLLLFSSVRSFYSHPDLLVIHHPLFQITPVLNTGLSLSEPLQLYKGYNAI